ncbi:MAG: hypothetical protein ACKVZ0_20485 [Gemmatimonadales bacterium]
MRLEQLELKAARQRALELSAREKAEKHERRIAQLRLESGLARSAEAFAADRPYGVQAIREVLLRAPARVWSAAEIHACLEQRGWISPSAQYPLQGTEAVISRLVRRGELRRVSRGRYVLAVTDGSPEERGLGLNGRASPADRTTR